MSKSYTYTEIFGAVGSLIGSAASKVAMADNSLGASDIDGVLSPAAWWDSADIRCLLVPAAAWGSDELTKLIFPSGPPAWLSGWAAPNYFFPMVVGAFVAAWEKGPIGSLTMAQFVSGEGAMRMVVGAGSVYAGMRAGELIGGTFDK